MTVPAIETFSLNPPSTSSADHSISNDQRWRHHRRPSDLEPSSLPSAASTPSATPTTPTPEDDEGFSLHSRSTSHDRSQSNLSASQQLGSATSQSSSGQLGINADDEDVRIAIMALGAMKSLDGQSGGLVIDSSADVDKRKTNQKSPTRTSSAFSNSSVTSTAISSPFSTPATELTHDSGMESPIGRGSRVGDSKLPTMVQDQDGNQVQVENTDLMVMTDADFLQRVSHIPIVRGTLRAYELGKQKSKVVKYGADLVESSVKTISRPVVSRLGASLGEKGVEQLDDFACRQLDRLYPTAVSSPTKEEKRKMLEEITEKETHEWKDMNSEEREKRKKAYLALKMEERERDLMVHELRQRKGKSKAVADDDSIHSPKSTTQPSSNPDDDGDDDDDNNGKDRVASSQQALVRSEQQPKGSRWGSMLVEAGATAGGLSAAMSEESMKSLKYCLQWLQYATAHIEHQITVLRDLMVRINHGELDVSGTAVQNLTSIKGDVVNTIRGVVDVVGKYAGNALPEPARNSVKAFILSLPARWATVNRSSVANTPNGYFGNSPSSPSFSSAHLSAGPLSAAQLAGGQRVRNAGTPREQMQAAATAQAANRILTLAVESLDILRSVTIVFGESLDRAELWVERLRILGLQRKRQHEQPNNEHWRIQEGRPTNDWENARGYSMSNRARSPDEESDVSMATTGSTKRRRVKNSRTSHSPVRQTVYPTSQSQTPLTAVSDDENLTETEKPSTGRSSLSTFSSVTPTNNASRPPPVRRRRAGTGSSKVHPPIGQPTTTTTADDDNSDPYSTTPHDDNQPLNMETDP